MLNLKDYDIARVRNVVDFVENLTKEDILNLCQFRLRNEARAGEIVPISPYKRLHNMVALVVIPYDSNTGITMTYDFLKKKGIDPEELIRATEKNLENKEFTVTSINSVLTKYLGEEIVSEMGEDPFPMYVITSMEEKFGASAIMRKDILDVVVEKVKENIIILPCSRHDLIAVPESAFPLHYAQEMIGEMNLCTFDKSDWLSDNVYVFDAKEKSIGMYDGKQIIPEDISVTLQQEKTIQQAKQR